MSDIKSDFEVVHFQNKWTLWFHEIDNKDWSINGFQSIFNIHNNEEFWRVYNNIKSNTEPTYTAGMFYLMRDDIQPMWEDERNRYGGVWSYRISRSESDKAWINFSIGLVCSIITTKPEYMQYITGISMSPKINNCILKIWTNCNKLTAGMITDSIGETKLVGGMYQQREKMLKQYSK